jgi:hypothetical protein
MRDDPQPSPPAPVLGFHPDRPCDQPGEHEGRRWLAEDMASRLLSAEMASIALVGEPRIGKSSFLRCLETELEGQAQVLRLDVEASRFQSDKHFFIVILEERVASSYGDFQVHLDELARSGQRLVLLLDNFQAAVSNRRLQASFFEYLRSCLSTRRCLGCVVASPAPLEDLCHEALRGSSFFNIFDSRTLGPLEDEEARSLLRRRLPPPLARDETGIESVVEAVGPRPYLLQLAGAEWVESWRGGGSPAVEPALERTYGAARPYYQAIWSGLSKKQREMTQAAARQTSFDERRLDNSFLERGWLRRDGGRLHFAARHFGRFACEELGVDRQQGFFARLFRR